MGVEERDGYVQHEVLGLDGRKYMLFDCCVAFDLHFKGSLETGAQVVGGWMMKKYRLGDRWWFGWFWIG